MRFHFLSLFSLRRSIGVGAQLGLLPCLAAVPALASFVPLSSDVNPLFYVLTIVLLIISLGIHEAAHAWVAWRCGDSTAKDLGRITLNPIPHIDPFMTILLPAMLLLTTHGAFVFGGAKPVPVSFHRLRHPWRDMAIVALAGPFSNLLLAIFFLIAWKVFVNTGWYNGASASDHRKGDLLPLVLEVTVQSNLLLAVFNLVPIPPLDGSRVMAWLLPVSVRDAYVGLERFGLFIVIGLMYGMPGFRGFLQEEVDALFLFLDRVVSLGGVW